MSRSLKDILPLLFVPAERWKLRLLTDWNVLAGNLKGKALIERIDNDVLHLKVSHPVWAQELLFLTPMLKKKINAHLGQEYIRHIHLKCIQQKDIVGRSLSKNGEKKQADKVPEPLDQNELRMLALVKSDGLQSILSSYFMVCKKNVALKREKKEKGEHDFSNKAGDGQRKMF